MITLRAGGYTDQDYNHLLSVLDKACSDMQKNYCQKYPDCSECPVRHACADLARLATHIEAVKP